MTPSLAGFPRGRARMPLDWDTTDQCLDAHLVYVCRQGRIAACLDGTRQSLSAGDICLVPPHCPFRFQSQALPVIARFRLSVRCAGREVAWGTRARIIAMDATLERLVDLLVDELHEHGSGPLAADLARAFCRAFATNQRRQGDAKRRRARLTGDQLAELAAAVARQPCAVTPRLLAHRLGLTSDWAARLIRAATGLSPRAWIVRERLRLAAELLTQSLSPGLVAQRLGYRDPRLFGRQFRAFFGCTPGAWQRRMRRE